MDPWFSSFEFEEVSEMVLDVVNNLDDKVRINRVVSVLNMWISRVPRAPMGVEATMELLTTAACVTSLDLRSCTQPVSDQLQLATGVIRFINRAAHTVQQSGADSSPGGPASGSSSIYHAAVHVLAIDRWLVTARHDATHAARLPPLHLLQTALVTSLHWLLDNYWTRSGGGSDDEDVGGGGVDLTMETEPPSPPATNSDSSSGATDDARVDALLVRLAAELSSPPAAAAAADSRQLGSCRRQLRDTARQQLLMATPQRRDVTLRWVAELLMTSPLVEHPPQRDSAPAILLATVTASGCLHQLLQLLLSAAALSPAALDWTDAIVAAFLPTNQKKKRRLTTAQRVVYGCVHLPEDPQIDWHVICRQLLLQRSPSAMLTLLPRVLQLVPSVCDQRRKLLLDLTSVSLGRQMALCDDSVSPISESQLKQLGVSIASSVRLCDVTSSANDSCDQAQQPADVKCHVTTTSPYSQANDTRLPAWSLCGHVSSWSACQVRVGCLPWQNTPPPLAISHTGPQTTTSH